MVKLQQRPGLLVGVLFSCLIKCASGPSLGSDTTSVALSLRRANQALANAKPKLPQIGGQLALPWLTKSHDQSGADNCTKISDRLGD